MISKTLRRKAGYMETNSDREVQKLKGEGNISTCPVCGYSDGFHVSFEMTNDNKNGQIILICPECHRRFQLGWHVTLEQ